jgi:CRP-like cAMP-binding protein
MEKISNRKENTMQTGGLGKVYQNGEIIIQQGTQGDCLYVIQEGKVEVFTESNGQEIHLAELSEGDFFGEMAVFEKSVRSTSVRALGRARALTVDKRTLLSRLEEDPYLAFRFLESMSTRIRGLGIQFAQVHSTEAQASDRALIEIDSSPNFAGITA